MPPLKPLWKSLFQRTVTGHWRPFRMGRAIPSFPQNLQQVGLYLHVPFCKNLCPFCPYNRVKYDDEAFARYERAVCEEIDLYSPHLQGLNFISLYIGGGTPTVNLPGLLRILAHLKDRLSLACDICIELHPSNMDHECLAALRECGVTLLSVGVESTSDRLLETIGRNHDGETALLSLERAKDAGFDSINADLMFTLPTQTLEDWKKDLRAVIQAEMDQISTYPLFSFPYSDLGVEKRLHKVERPSGSMIRAMLRVTDELAKEAGYERCAVWSWIKPRKKKFSSITRHHYIGFGPSAASMIGDNFYVNTFDVKSYADSLPENRPIALSLPMDRNLEMAYWLYWRVYELHIEEEEFVNLFGGGETLDRRFGHLFRPLSLAGMIQKRDGGYKISNAGAYWIHRLQNEYSLNYINRLWGKCRKEPWPQTVTL